MKGTAVNKTNTVLSSWGLTSDRGVKVLCWRVPATVGALQSKEKNTGPNSTAYVLSFLSIK